MQVLAAKFLVAAAAALALSAPVRAQEAVSYPDVPHGHWAANAIGRLSQAGLIEGRPDGSFGGERAMTRYEFGVAMARLRLRNPRRKYLLRLSRSLGAQAELEQAEERIRIDHLDSR